MVEPSSSSQAAPPPPPSDAEREEMLDRMLTRLALADDSKLEGLLSKILPYSISSLSSISPSIRKLVMEISSNVNKRVKFHTEIALPPWELWNVYNESSASPMVRNFCIVYIEMGLDRLSSEEKADMGSDLVVNVFGTATAASRYHSEDCFQGSNGSAEAYGPGYIEWNITIS